MGKKKINIALILLVLGLWGTVIYKSVNQYFFPNELALNDIRANAKFNFNQIKKDTFDLETIQRDPFLDTKIEPEKIIAINKIHTPSVRIVNKPIAKPSIIWPQISYYGYIKSQNKTERLILIKIDNQFHKLRKNDQIDGLFIKMAYNDSIQISFNKENKTIYLSK